MTSNHRAVFKTLQDTLASATTSAVNKASLTAFKESNKRLREEEGIPKIPIYRNVQFKKATLNKPTSTLLIFDRAQVNPKHYSPIQTATGISFMRPVKIGGMSITAVAHAFIPKRLEHNQNPESRPFKRVGKSRLPIVKVKTSTLFDYYSYIMVQDRLIRYYNDIIVNVMQKELVKRLSAV